MTEPRAHVDAVVFGAGFAGLYAHHLRGLGLSIQGYEGAADVGGTWWWHRYPRRAAIINFKARPPGIGRREDGGGGVARVPHPRARVTKSRETRRAVRALA